MEGVVGKEKRSSNVVPLCGRRFSPPVFIVDGGGGGRAFFSVPGRQRSVRSKSRIGFFFCRDFAGPVLVDKRRSRKQKKRKSLIGLVGHEIDKRSQCIFGGSPALHSWPTRDVMSPKSHIYPHTTRSVRPLCRDKRQTMPVRLVAKSQKQRLSPVSAILP